MDYAVKILAVIGGAALGAIVVSLVVRFASRMLGVTKSPRRALFALRALGAVAAGWVVWLLVFGSGGSGIGGLGGFGRGGGPSPEAGDGDKKQSETQLTLGSPATQPSKTLAIAMLGGSRVTGERFYLVVGDKEPLSLDRLKDIIRSKQKDGLAGIDIWIYENSVAADHAAVKNLQDWAQAQQLAVKVSLTGAEAP
jgi:hypothetical protein